MHFNKESGVKLGTVTGLTLSSSVRQNWSGDNFVIYVFPDAVRSCNPWSHSSTDVGSFWPPGSPVVYILV